MKKEIREQWIRENGFWVLVYGLIFVYFMARFYGQTSDAGLYQWSHFKEAMALPLVFLLAAVFINLFSNRIILPPTEEAKASGKADELERIDRSQSLQRRNWMIFAYGFMLFSLLVPIYMFGPGWDKVNGPGGIENELKKIVEELGNTKDGLGNTRKELSKTQEGAGSVQEGLGKAQEGLGKAQEGLKSIQGKLNDTFHPIAVFIGCTKDDRESELSCNPEKSVDSDDPNKSKSAWVLNLGGHVVNAVECGGKKEGVDQICQVRGGLLVPLYVIILALMGGSISLTRRLPEYQKCANPRYVPTGKEKKLTQHEFREYLIFQIVQFVSAPLIAILAYFLIDPSSPSVSVALAFSAGFASESILLKVRALVEKLAPKSTSPTTGTIFGVVQFADTRGRIVYAENAEVSLTALPQVRVLTDETGFYVLHNVPVGEHGMKVSLAGHEPATGSVEIKHAQELVKQHWNLKKKT